MLVAVHADVAKVSVVVGGGENTAQTAVDREMFADAITGTEGETVEVLAAVHVGVDVVAVETEGAVGVAEGTEKGDFAFEAAETIFVSGFTTTAYEGEIELKAEGTVDPSGLERGDDGGFGVGFESLGGRLMIVDAVLEGLEGGLNLASLIGGLEINTEVESRREEVDTGGVGIDAAQGDAGILSGIAQEGDTLVGIGEIATGHHAQGAAEEHGRQYNFLHESWKNIV